MSIIYSGQTIVNTTIDGATATSLNFGLQSVLVAAGWTVVTSGSGTGIWRLRSAATPQGLQTDLWIRNAASPATTCLLTVSSTTATNYNTTLQSATDSAMLTGSGFVYNIIATGFYVYLVRNVTPCPAGSNFMVMVPMVPAFLSGLVTSLIISSTGYTDPYEITRNSLFVGNPYNNFSYLNGLGMSSGTVGSKWNIMGTSSATKPTWYDLSTEFYEPRVMCFGTTALYANTTPILACGYMWDALVINSAMTRGTTIGYDGNSWTVFTENQDPGLMILSA